MPAPAMTFNTQANALSSQSLAGAANITFDVDASAKFEVQVQIKDARSGSVSATTGLKIEVFRLFGAGPTVDTEPIGGPIQIASVASTTKYLSFALSTGKYRIRITNLDATVASTVEATTSTIDSIS